MLSLESDVKLSVAFIFLFSLFDKNREDLYYRVSTSPPIFASCRDCPSYLASTKTVRDLLLPAETVVLGKKLPAETVRVI